jgi:hypothetical protein
MDDYLFSAGFTVGEVAPAGVKSVQRMIIRIASVELSTVMFSSERE